MRSAGAVPKNGSAARERNGAIYGWGVMGLELCLLEEAWEEGATTAPRCWHWVVYWTLSLTSGSEDRESCLYAASQARCFYILLSPFLYIYIYM